MAEGQGRLHPPVRFWYEDQPDGAIPRVGEVKWAPTAYGSLNYASSVFIEISRSGALLRGGALGVALIAAIIGIWQVWVLIPYTPILSVMGTIIFFALSWFGIRLDLGTPFDTPVRFNRARGEIYIYEHERKWNPFVRWPVTIKVFDWDRTHAEIAKQAGTNGTVYAVNYALFISQCKPGTLEVEDRVKLGDSSIAEYPMRALWDYCRLYMTNGLDGLPEQEIKRDPGKFFDCLFFAMPVFNPTEGGREARRHVSIWLLSIVMLTVSWVLLPMGLLRYVAFKLAPKPKWPAHIDAESRSAPADCPVPSSSKKSFEIKSGHAKARPPFSRENRS